MMKKTTIILASAMLISALSISALASKEPKETAKVEKETETVNPSETLDIPDDGGTIVSKGENGTSVIEFADKDKPEMSNEELQNSIDSGDIVQQEAE